MLPVAWNLEFLRSTWQCAHENAVLCNSSSAKTCKVGRKLLKKNFTTKHLVSPTVLLWGSCTFFSFPTDVFQQCNYMLHFYVITCNRHSDQLFASHVPIYFDGTIYMYNYRQLNRPPHPLFVLQHFLTCVFTGTYCAQCSSKGAQQRICT